jgi:ABC-type antimicrobial peptide transport system permease subunit
LESIMNFRFFRAKHDRELDEEIQSHLRMAAQDHIERGLGSAEAEAAAHREMGNAGLIKEVTREMWGWTSFERLLQDLHFGARILRKHPGSTFVSVLTLALGIGASTAIFSVVYGVLLRPLPYDKPEQIVRVWEVDSKGEQGQIADPNFDDLRAQNHSLQALAEFDSGVHSVGGGSEPVRLRVASVSRDFFSVMGVHPLRGREFAANEQQPGAAPVALVSYSFWQQYLNAASDFSSLKLVVENKATSVIGVLPPEFHFPADTDVWMPRELDSWLPARNAHNWSVLGRLREGVSVEQAQTDLGAIARRLKLEYGENIDMQDAAVAPLKTALTADARPALLTLLGAVVILLLVACANVMNLLLAQASAREGELAIRSALGASRGRLVRQFLAETLLLSLAGGLLGVIAAYFGVQSLLRMAPPSTPRIADVTVNLPVLFFALGLSILVATALGVFTALRATSGDTQVNLAEGGRAQSGARNSQRLGRMIIAGQLAMTLFLLVGAGLEGRSLLRVLSVDPGFRTERVVTMDFALPSAAGPLRAQRVQFLSALCERLIVIPGVSEAGVTNFLPLANKHSTNGVFVELNPEQLSPKIKNLIERSAHTSLEELDQASLQEIIGFFQDISHDPTRSGEADYAIASEGYFRALGIPLLQGRLFNEGDTADTAHVALISESVARKQWPGQSPLGHTIEFGGMDGDLRLLTVVGVVGDVRERSVESPPRPAVYVNYRQRPHHRNDFSVVMRTSADPGATLAAARRILTELDPTIPPRLTTFTEVVAASLNTRRFNLALVGVFAGTALLLAVAGIYGVLAYFVSRRTREIGIRVALGANAGSVLNLVLGQAMATAATGVGAGIVGAFVFTRLMRSLLFDVSPTDPLTFAVVALALLVVAGIASYLPARRAARVDPTIALRCE